MGCPRDDYQRRHARRSALECELPHECEAVHRTRVVAEQESWFRNSAAAECKSIFGYSRASFALGAAFCDLFAMNLSWTRSSKALKIALCCVVHTWRASRARSKAVKLYLNSDVCFLRPEAPKVLKAQINSQVNRRKSFRSLTRGCRC